MKTNLADKWFSLYIRLRDSDENGYAHCSTCGAIKFWRDMDCGHFIKRQNMSLRFSEINCSIQCRKCNWLEQGNDIKFKDFLINKYGIDKYNLLLSAKNDTRKISTFEISEIAKYYKQKAVELAKEKGIKL